MENKIENMNIKTPRLVIKNLQAHDLTEFYSYRSNPEVAKYQGFDVMTVEQARSFIENNATKKFGKAGEWVQYAIADKSTGKLVGDCAIKLDQYDTRPGEIGITISPEEQKKGYAKESLIAILNFLFSLEGFHRVTETVDAENIASIQLLKTTGFRQEGYFIENIFFKGSWGSEYQFAMLKTEWQELKPRFL
jgi:RimJ/RimL family protein N-acetyltransferase